MNKSDDVRLRHMLGAARDALAFAAGKSRKDLDSDRLLTLGLVKSIEIIGEAANHVSDKTRQQLSEILWQDIIDMRHRLTHAYYDINLDILWQTVTEDLPPLIAALDKNMPA